MSLRQVHRRTYHTSSLFFPRATREDVFVLYGFVRVADGVRSEERLKRCLDHVIC